MTAFRSSPVSLAKPDLNPPATRAPASSFHRDRRADPIRYFGMEIDVGFRRFNADD